MRVVFMGSAELACPSLAEIPRISGMNLAGVVTRPERPRGRALRMAPCPVGAFARRMGLPLLTPERVNSPAALAELAALSPDIIVVVAYGQILKHAVLELPPRGCINLHASLLPKYRGAAPIQWAIARGESLTGVTTMFMNAAMDEGDVILQEEEPIRASDTAATLHDRLALLGARLLRVTLEGLRSGKTPRHVQDHAQATYAPRLKKTDGCLDWRRPALELHNRVRGFYPWPGCYLRMAEPRMLTVKVLASRVEPNAGRAPPGTVLDVAGAGPLIAAGEGALRLLRVKPEGRRDMTGAAFLCGHPLVPGSRLPDGGRS